MTKRWLILVLALAACDSVRDIDENGRTPLMRAAQAGRLSEVQRLANDRTINDQVKDHSSLRYMIAFLSWMQELPERRAGWTALSFAVDGGHVDVVRELLRRGADPNVGPPSDRPIGLSIGPRRNPAVLQALLAAGAIPDSVQPAPVQRAAMLADTTFLHLLLQAGASVNRSDRATPLITATRRGSLPVVEQLLRAGADVNAKDKDQGWTALDFALAMGRDDIAAALTDAGADRKPEQNRALITAIEAGDIAEVKRLLANGADPNMTDEKRRLALAIAIDNKREDIAFALLDAGAITPGRTRVELLYAAAFAGADSVIKVLVGDSLKPSPYHLGAAAAGGNLSTVRLLLQKGADPNGDGGVPLREAIRGGNAAVVQALLAAGANVNGASRGETPLAYAVRGRAVNVTRVLLDAGANASVPGSEMPLIYTPIVYDDTVTAALLLAKGADINAADSRGLTVLDHAFRLKKSAATIAFLERRGARRSAGAAQTTR
jgi:ankyrin repeat protein